MKAIRRWVVSKEFATSMQCAALLGKLHLAFGAAIGHIIMLVLVLIPAFDRGSLTSTHSPYMGCSRVKGRASV